MSLWSRKPFIAVRTLGRSGQYPSLEIREPSHIYCASPELVWTAVLQAPLPTDWELGEATQLAPEEVRLFAAVTLSEGTPWDNGMPVVTHWRQDYLRADVTDSDLSSPTTFERIHEHALTLGPDVRPPRSALTTAAYEVRDTLGDRTDAIELLTAINSGDQLQLAGLARLLGANRLLDMNEPEEAAIALYLYGGGAGVHTSLSKCGTRGRGAALYRSIRILPS